MRNEQIINNINNINNIHNNGDENSDSSDESQRTYSHTNSSGLSSTECSENPPPDNEDCLIVFGGKKDYYGESPLNSGIKYLFYPSLKFEGKSNLPRKSIYMSCIKSIYDLIVDILVFLKIYDNEIILPNIKKICFSFSDNKIFFLKLIKDLFCELTYKNIRGKKQNSKNASKKLRELLEKENNNSSQTIKVLNGIFNLPFYDFLLAYLNDKCKLYITNDKDGKSIVNFSKDEFIEDLPKDYHLFEFKTYKSCFNHRYSKKQKVCFKEKVLKRLARIMGIKARFRKKFIIKK